MIEQIIKHLDTLLINNWNTYFSHTKHGAEIDLILEGHFGRVPIEIKFGQTVTAKQRVTLKAFLNENNLPLDILINQAENIRMIAENIIQIPVRYVV